MAGMLLHDEAADSISRVEGSSGKVHVAGYVWDTGSLAWVRETQAAAGGGGDATAANQVTGNNSLASIDAGTPAALGQTTMAASMPVVLASDQTDINVQITDGAGTVNTKQVGTAITGADVGLVAHSMIHGLSTAGGGTYVDVKVNPSGALTVEQGNVPGGLAPVEYDEVALTYVTVGNGVGQVETVVYKLATVTQATLTMTYDGSDRLTGVVKT